MGRRRLAKQDYTIGWICPLSIELAAAKAVLDEEHDGLEYQDASDGNVYTLGSIQKHNIVIASLSGQYGVGSAAAVAQDMLRTFDSLRFGLLVGVGGGIPSSRNDIRLGDVVVSHPSGTNGGVVQYDLGKVEGSGRWVSKGSLNSPPQILLSATETIKADRLRGTFSFTQHMEDACLNAQSIRKAFCRPDPRSDLLFKSEYNHPADANSCDACNTTELLTRTPRTSKEPYVHYGTIASGNMVMKSGIFREIIAKSIDGGHDVLCYEMEAAGLMPKFPCLVIRGICDYADSHKSKAWQPYAAIVAASYAKALLLYIPVIALMQQEPAVDLCNRLLNEMDTFKSETLDGISSHYHTEDERKCHQHFKSVNYEETKNRIPERSKGTFKWIFRHDLFISWSKSRQDALLWITADPGCGKSVFCRSLIEFGSRYSQKHIIGYYFFNSNSQQNDLSTALCALLHQMFSQRPDLLHHAMGSFKRDGHKLSTEQDELWRILIAAGRDHQAASVTIILDALDECKAEHRLALISHLKEFQASSQKQTSRLRFLVTGRPYADIRRMWTGITGGLPSIHIPGEEKNFEISQEINLVIDAKVNEISAQLELSRGLRKVLKRELMRFDHRTYLWLDLILDEIRHATGIKRTKKAYGSFLRTLPGTIYEAYDRILLRNQSPETMIQVEVLLKILIGAARPLCLQELQIAYELALGENIQSFDDIDLESISDFEARIRELCGLFIFVANDVVHLIHQTAMDFLLRSPEAPLFKKSTFTWAQSISGSDAQLLMARISMKYLLLLGHSGYSESYFEREWEEHYRRVEYERNFSLSDMAMDLYTNVVLPKCLRYQHLILSRPSVIHHAAMRGHWTILRRIFNASPANNASSAEFAANERDGQNFTPLLYASRFQRPDAVTVLLDAGADVNASVEMGVTALLDASIHGNVNILTSLLDAGASIVACDDYGNTPLHLAIRNGNSMAASLLIESGSDIHARSMHDNTPLHDACFRYDSAQVIGLLLDSGADARCTDDWGSTPLHLASALGSPKSVECILSHNTSAAVDPVMQGTKSPAFHHRTNEDLLLRMDRDGETPLHTACHSGNSQIVEILLEHGSRLNADHQLPPTSTLSGLSRWTRDTWIEAKNTKGKTALHLAAESGDVRTVHILLAYNADPDAKDRHNKSPYTLAREARRTMVMEFLRREWLRRNGMETGVVGWGKVYRLEDAVAAVSDVGDSPGVASRGTLLSKF